MSINALAEIGLRAIDLTRKSQAVRDARAQLRAAYADYKSQHGFGHVPHDDPRLEAMFLATAKHAQALGLAQKEERSARGKLERLCRKVSQ